MNCADNQKVNYVVFMLIGEPKYWWDSTRRLLEGGRIIITWEVFRTRFLEKYFPNVRRTKEIEFMQLKQGSMTIGEYASKFEELGKYSTFFYHPEERMKCIKIENGLRLELRKVVGILEIFYFPTLIHKCRFLEDFENNQNNKPKYFGPQTNKNKRKEEKPYNCPQWRSQSSQSASGNCSGPIYNHIRCFKCRQGHHSKDCHLKGPICFMCRKPDHLFSECGQQKPHFNPTTTKARPTTTGMCFIKGKTLNVLYNSGATHPFPIIVFNTLIYYSLRIENSLFKFSMSTFISIRFNIRYELIIFQSSPFELC